MLIISSMIKSVKDGEEEAGSSPNWKIFNYLGEDLPDL